MSVFAGKSGGVFGPLGVFGQEDLSPTEAVTVQTAVDASVRRRKGGRKGVRAGRGAAAPVPAEAPVAITSEEAPAPELLVSVSRKGRKGSALSRSAQPYRNVFEQEPGFQKGEEVLEVPEVLPPPVSEGGSELVLTSPGHGTIVGEKIAWKHSRRPLVSIFGPAETEDLGPAEDEKFVAETQKVVGIPMAPEEEGVSAVFCAHQPMGDVFSTILDFANKNADKIVGVIDTVSAIRKQKKGASAADILKTLRESQATEQQVSTSPLVLYNVPQAPTPPAAPETSPGMSTTTIVLLASGGVAAVVLALALMKGK